MSFEVDPSNCDREPIHIPGAIQPHGVLFSVDEENLNVCQVSENAGALLGRPADQILERPFSALLDSHSDARFRAALSTEAIDSEQATTLIVLGQKFEASVHRHAGATLVELEPAAPDDGLPAIERRLQNSVARIQAANDPEALYETAVLAFHRLTGFDRVLLYRFDEDDHGEVIAEVRAPGQQSYLGLHFPAADIPKQARELDRLNPVRIIPDAAYRPAALVPTLRPDTREPLDLSYAILRSVSPIHCEYLGNMGVRASMSLSILDRGALWGLVSFHHTSPRSVPPRIRIACEILARTVGLQNTVLSAANERARHDARIRGIDALGTMVSRGRERAVEALIGHGDMLCDVVDASAVAVNTRGKWWTHGSTPSPDTLDALETHIRSQSSQGIYASHALGKDWPRGDEVPPAATGVLAIVLPSGGALLWFRPEVVQSVRWAGDPHKSVDVDPSGRLRPRRSFALWREEVRGTASRWESADQAAALALRRRILEADLIHQLDRAERAVRSRDDMMAVVSHDLRNPLSAVRTGVEILRLRGDQNGGSDAGNGITNVTQRMTRSLDRMEQLIGDLLDAARIDAGRFVVQPSDQPLAPVIAEALALMEPVATRKGVRLEAPKHASIKARYEERRILQVLVNLMTNAIRHTPSGGTVRLEVRRHAGEARVTVADTGPGIPPGQADKLFERYWQEGGDHHAGTAGLGLYIAHGIVESHGGRIWVEKPSGTGATFVFTLSTPDVEVEAR